MVVFNLFSAAKEKGIKWDFSCQIFQKYIKIKFQDTKYDKIRVYHSFYEYITLFSLLFISEIKRYKFKYIYQSF